MSKSKSKLSKKPKNPFVNPKFVTYQMPGTNIPFQDRINAISIFGAKAEQEFGRDTERLHAEIVQTNPIQLLCSCSYYYLVSRNFKNREWTESDNVFQPHIELLQSFVLKHDWDEYKMQRTDPTPIISLAKNVSRAFIERRLKDLTSNLTNEEIRSIELKEDVRAHTQVVRNWGYPQHMWSILTSMVSPLDQFVLVESGLKASSCVDMLFRLVKCTENRMNDWLQAQADFLGKTDKTMIFQRYKELFPYDPRLPETQSFVNDPKISLKQFKEHLFVSNDLLLPIIYRFTVAEVCELYGEEVNPAAIKSLLTTWSLPFGGTANSPDDHLFMGSPIKTHPFILMPDDSFVLPIPGLLNSFCLELVEQLFNTQQLKDAYHKRRSSFLEEELCRLLKEYFPHGEIFAGSQWPEGNEIYENDALLILDSFALVCEAKSGRVAASARRGGDRLDNEINKLVVESAKQASGFATYLCQNPGTHQFKTKSGIVNQVDTTRVRHVLTLSVTLDDIKLRWNVGGLMGAQVVDKEVPKVPCLMLADLFIIFDILSTETQRIHYLYRASQLDNNISFVGDEVDLLALYFKTRLFLNAVPGTQYMGIGESSVFEEYYLKSFDGLPTDKPAMPLNPRWQNIIRGLEESQISGWSELGQMLLNVSIKDQQKIETKLTKLARNLKKGTSTHNYLAYRNLSTNPNEVLIFLVSSRMDNRLRRETLLNLIDSQCTDATRVIGIAINDIDSEIPYSALACGNVFESTGGGKQE